MDLERFQSYVGQVQELASQKKEVPDIQREIVALIQSEDSQKENPPYYSAFLQGELLFHTGQYEQSLKHYLAAKGIPLFQFFCYRASSAIASNRGQRERAIAFAEKAAMLNDADPLIQEILQGLEHGTLAESLEVQHESIACEMVPSYEPLNMVEEESCERPSAEEEWGLEQVIETFRCSEDATVNLYLERLKHRSLRPESFFCALNGWNFPADRERLAPKMLIEPARKSLGGHYIRWEGKGIVINPGRGFIEHFHGAGFCIRDIDFVIVTKDWEDDYSDVRAIYELNNQLNKCTPQLQIIHYYLNQKTFQSLAAALKPSLKQARHTIHNLEIFLDSPDVEKAELTEYISLHYFLAPPEPLPHATLGEAGRHDSNLGIKLELASKEGALPLKVGYISGLGWSPLIPLHLGYCDLLLAGFGNTEPKDYGKIAYNKHSLGYYGCSALLTQVLPKLMLLTEFGGREGDLRLEVTKSLRKELPCTIKLDKAAPIVIPADIGMLVDLKKMSIRCSLTGNDTPLENIRVTTTAPQFGNLQYLSSTLCL